MRHGFTSIGGSNPPSSAINFSQEDTNQNLGMKVKLTKARFLLPESAAIKRVFHAVSSSCVTLLNATRRIL